MQKEVEIMSGINLIPYDKVDVMATLREIAIKVLGQEKWDEIVAGIEVPADNMGSEQASHATRELLRRFESLLNGQTVRSILCSVQHGLKVAHLSWARERFLQFGDIDAFCAAMQQENLRGFASAVESGKSFHGQPIDQAVFDFVRQHPYLLYGARAGNTIRATAIPYRTQAYLNETDPVQKRYFACHCHFARESILQPEGLVSKNLCSCSLGHTKVFWEAVLDVPLVGEVIESALGGDLLCTFVIHLPDEIMVKYVHQV